MKNKKLFNTIAIVGVGLIGGSIGLTVKKRKLADKIIGLGRSKLSLKKALKKKAVDEISLDKSKVKDADLVIFATPVSKIVPLVKELLPYFKKGVVITDVGSTKREITKGLDKILPPDIPFIGAHPLAGSEKHGVEFSSAELFEKNICFLVPRKNIAKPFSKIKKFWKKLGANPIAISAEEHDFLMAGISHFPHIVAVALVNSLSGVNWRGKNITTFSGQGWKDTTRIAEGLPEVWLDIFLSNADKLVIFMEKFDKEWDQIKTSLQEKEFNKLKRILEQAHIKFRGSKPSRHKR